MWCKGCGRPVKRADFGADSRSATGRQSRCKSCRAKYSRAWRRTAAGQECMAQQATKKRLHRHVEKHKAANLTLPELITSLEERQREAGGIVGVALRYALADLRATKPTQALRVLRDQLESWRARQGGEWAVGVGTLEEVVGRLEAVV